jgi:serine protease inhibitor
MTRTRYSIGLIVGSCLLAVAACSGGSGDASGHATGGSLLEASDVSMRAAAHKLSYAETAAAVRALGYDMVRSVHDDDGNIVVSPTSLALALALAREGAGPEAAGELDQLLGAERDRRQVYNALLHEFEDVGKGSQLDVADAAFIDDDFGPLIREEYLAAIKSWYGAGLHSTDFGTSRGADDVNAWVDQQTRGRIGKLVADLDPMTVLVLVNAMYLEAAWTLPFSERDTDDADFLTGSGDVVEVPMMSQRSMEAEYATGSTWQALRLPYRGNELAMWVLLPTAAGVDPATLLEPKVLDSLARPPGSGAFDVGLPRWDTSSEGSLKSMLEDVGLDASFQEGAFSGIADDPRLQLQDVVQKANITVTEDGTVGAAATGDVFIFTSGPAYVGSFVVNHPFAFVVMHEPSGMPIFEGVVVDPS